MRLGDMVLFKEAVTTKFTIMGSKCYRNIEDKRCFSSHHYKDSAHRLQRYNKGYQAVHRCTAATYCYRSSISYCNVTTASAQKFPLSPPFQSKPQAERSESKSQGEAMERRTSLHSRRKKRPLIDETKPKKIKEEEFDVDSIPEDVDQDDEDDELCLSEETDEDQDQLNASIDEYQKPRSTPPRNVSTKKDPIRRIPEPVAKPVQSKRIIEQTTTRDTSWGIGGVLIGGLCMVLIAFCLIPSGTRVNGDENCTFKGGRSYWDAVDDVQNANSEIPHIKNLDALQVLKDSLSSKREDNPLVLLLVGTIESRADMFAASEWLASSLLASRNNSLGHYHNQHARASYIVGQEYHTLSSTPPSERKNRFHSTVAQGLRECGKTLLAVDASLVLEFLDLLSPAIEDGANPHLQLYDTSNNNHKKDDSREISTRETIIIFIASLSDPDFATAKQSTDLMLGKIKERFKWEDRFCQRISKIIPF